ncbi:MAG: serine hydrolase domain-containing protein [Acidimicrobiia bacterium]|nr:serine hydrolase domain-containing protein [Acidimicrobiia bacterium]
MNAPIVQIDPGEAGFDPQRLERIDRHFEKYVDDGRLPGWQIVVSRGGEVVHSSTYGNRDIESGAPWEHDTVARMYSMTKPVTSVAAMMLYEEGAFQLKDPVADYIPAFADTEVFRGGSILKPVTEPQIEPMRVWHLLTHTSGLTYGFHNSHAVDAIYRGSGLDEFDYPPGLDLEQICDRWAALPLVFQPGTSWNYSVATDVVGRLVEVVSGMPLDEFVRTRITEPLKMSETEFWVQPDQVDRLASLYVPSPKTGQAAVPPAAMGAVPTNRPDMISGGGGLYGTAADYLRFAHMLLNRGELDGTRLLSPRTVDFMTENHLPGNVDLEAFGQSTFAETSFDGVGFGLGFSVMMDPIANGVLSSPGEFAWGGAASTAFWVDPLEEIVAVFLTQLLPSSTHPIRPQLKQLVYQSLVD